MSRVIKLAIRGHLEGKLIHFNLTYTMNIRSRIQCVGGSACTHTFLHDMFLGITGCKRFSGWELGGFTQTCSETMNTAWTRPQGEQGLVGSVKTGQGGPSRISNMLVTKPSP